MRQCTVEYTQRIEEVALAAVQLVRLRISNSHELLSIVPRMKHQWTLQVELEAQPDACLPHGAALPDLIKEVRFGLKPAFRIISYGSQTLQEEIAPAPSYVEVKEAPFQVTATSHVAADVPIVVIWQDWLEQPPLRLNHSLNFTRDGGSWDYGVDLRSVFTGVTEYELEQNSTATGTTSSVYSELQSELLLRAEERISRGRGARNLVIAEVGDSRPGFFRSAWNETCRRLPKMQLPIRAAQRTKPPPCSHYD